jgi:subfamily B ATP-binding cassette protein MsbA
LVVREPLTILFSIITMFVISASWHFFVIAFIPISGIIISRVGKI